MSTTTKETGPVRPGEDWRHRAACRGVNPELFHPVATAGAVFEAQVAAAKAVCARCPVVAECLASALATLPHGIAGGLTEQERRVHRARVRPVVRTVAARISVIERRMSDDCA
jgi:hypothetical protein